MAGPEVKAPVAMVGLDSLTNMITEIHAIDEKMVVIKGTAAEWSKKGEAAARATMLSTYFANEKAMRQHQLAILAPIATAATIGEYIDAVSSLKTEAEMFGSLVSIEWIKGHRTDSDDMTALATRRDELVSQANAFRDVFATPMFLSQFGLASADDLPTVPAAKATPKAGSTSTRAKKAGTKTMHYYYFRDGVRAEMPKSQDTFSSIPWYRFKARVEAFEQAFATQHGKVDRTTPWEGDVTIAADLADDKKGRTVRIGWEYVADEQVADTPDEDEATGEKALVEGADAIVADIA